ncbi:MAG TPA: DUF2182 domain-containing protein [Anaeromyxobacter sp.]
MSERELSFRRDRRALVAALAAASLVCWIWTARVAAQMAGEHGHPHAHRAAGLLALFAMWAVMMAGMMIPPEVPAVLEVARARRERLGRSPFPAAAAFLAGYLLPWTAFSLAAAWLQQRLHALDLLGPDMAASSRVLSAAVLLAAGAIQLSPLKRACLARCRAPTSPGGERTLSSFAGGLRASAVSIASCGSLMLVLFVTGVMSLPWMGLMTLLLVLERVVPRSFRISAAAGAVLLLWGAWTAAGSRAP